MNHKRRQPQNKKASILLNSGKFDDNGGIVPLKFKCLVGRNDACPCKSGKKFKRCCGENDNHIDTLVKKLKPQKLQDGKN